jgi:probable rRNA maturation factor
MSVPSDRSGGLLQEADEPVEAEPPERLTLTLVEEEGDWSGLGPLQEAIDDVAGALARDPRLELERGSEASIVLASDRMVRRLNCAHRGKDAATNVLSFPFQRPPGATEEADAYLGDVVLASETVRREAAERGIDPGHHLRHLVVHGVLHLMGWDHATDAAAAEMEGLETELLAGMGIADPYAVAAEA